MPFSLGDGPMMDDGIDFIFNYVTEDDDVGDWKRDLISKLLLISKYF